MSIDFRKHRNQIFQLRFFRQASTHDGISYIFFYLLLLSQAAAQSSAPASNPYGGLEANFNPSMAIIIVVLISAFFFMGFFSVYIRQCAGEGSTSRSVRRAGNVNNGRSRRGQRGLDLSVIETFPTFLYSEVKGLKIGKGTLECAVCLNEFEDDETLRMLPKCDHVFHPECIDVWLISHTTCPVCRANLASESGITATDGVPTGDNATGVSDSESESDHAPEIESVAINVRNEDSRCSEQHHQQQPDVVSPSTLPIQIRPVRSKSIREKIFGKFPRSHSTGHSLIQPGENCERFTLRLPEDVRKQIMLNRTTSCVAFPPDEGSFSRRSSRRGYRGAVGEGSSRGKYYQFWKIDSQRAKSDRWVFSKAPPFLSKGPSVWSPKGVDGEGSGNSRSLLTSVKTPFDCLNAKGDGSQQDTSRLPV